MRWNDEGIVLSIVGFGEKNHLVSVLTQNHGRHKGIFKGSKQQQSSLNPGTHVICHWHARLEDHLGLWRFENIYTPLAWVLHNPTALYALSSAIALTELLLPEREPQPDYYLIMKALITAFQHSDWLRHYINMELTLIEFNGFPLDLHQCAVTGQHHDLVYVSPRSGKAVSRQHGLPYHDRLLTLPSFFNNNMAPTLDETLSALELTEYFLDRYSLGIHGQTMPTARIRFKEHLKTQSKRESA